MNGQVYSIEAGTPEVADYCNIRQQAGLSPKTIEAATQGLKGTVYGVKVVSQGRVVGMGRIIGDGGCFYQIVDIAVLPDHQKKGLGAKVTQALVEYLQAQAPKSAYISLIADPGTPAFYQKFGFKLCSPGGDGMFLKL